MAAFTRTILPRRQVLTQVPNQVGSYTVQKLADQGFGLNTLFMRDYGPPLEMRVRGLHREFSQCGWPRQVDPIRQRILGHFDYRADFFESPYVSQIGQIISLTPFGRGIFKYFCNETIMSSLVDLMMCLHAYPNIHVGLNDEFGGENRLEEDDALYFMLLWGLEDYGIIMGASHVYEQIDDTEDQFTREIYLNPRRLREFSNNSPFTMTNISTKPSGVLRLLKRAERFDADAMALYQAVDQLYDQDRYRGNPQYKSIRVAGRTLNTVASRETAHIRVRLGATSQ